jgi:PAS domain S-box-containing protein
MVKKHQIYAIEDLKPGDHLCCLYETDEEHKSLLTPYMRFGLEKNEKVFYIVDSHTSQTVLDYLRDDGVDVDPYIQSGQLTILTVSESYMKGGIFDPDEMIKMLTEETKKAINEGYSALRVTGEMSWALKGLPGSERLIEYEAKLNEFFPHNNALAICQYDMRLFKPEILLNVLLTHPIVVIGTRIYENFYFMPPEKYPFDIPESTLKEWIKSLEVYNDADKFREKILNSMMDGLSILDADGVHQDVNVAFCKITGFSRDELIGTGPPHLYWPEEEYENIQVAFENTLKGDADEFELIFKRKNGERFPVIVSPSIMRDERDNIIAALATVKDISERKKTEEKIKQSEWISKAILESSNDSIFSVDDSGMILEVNSATAERLRTTPADMIGSPIKKFIPPELFKSRWKYFDKALKTKKTVEFEDERDGLFLHHSISPVFEEKKVKLAVFSQDITESKKTANELKESHSKLEATLKAIPDLMFEVDSDGRFYDYYAPKSEDLYVPPESFLGKKISEVLPEDATHKILRAIHKADETGSHEGTTYSLDLPSGEKWFEVSIAKKTGTSPDDKELFVAVARDITKRKKNEEAIQRALNYNRSLIEASQDPLVTIGSDGKITDLNDSVELVTGLKREEILGTDFSDYFTDPDKAKVGYEEVFSKGFVKDYSLTIRHKDGHVTPVLYNATVFRDDDGEVLGVFAAARDISQLKKAEKELSDSQSRLNSILEGSPIPKFVIDKDHKIIYWNKALEELSGIRAEDVIGTQDHWKAFYDKKRPTMADLLVDGALKKLSQWYGDKCVKSKFLNEVYEAVDFFPVIGENGKWLFFTAAPIKDSEGDMIGAVETLEDITESKKAEIALQKSEERFRAVAESAVDAVVTTDVNGIIRFFNNSLIRIFGYSKEELTGKSLTILMPKQLRSKYLDELERFKKSGEHRLIGKTVETTGLKKYGAEFPFEMSLSSWKSGQKTFFTSIIRDLTEKKKAEEEIKKQIILTTSINNVLQESLKAKKDEEVALICLEVAEKLTNSEFGLIMEVNEVGKVDTIAVSDPGWLNCQIPQPKAVKLLSGMEIVSYWGRIIKEGKSQIVNHPEFDPDSRGVPEGHLPIKSFLGVPLKRGDKNIGLIGLANKVGGYDHIDLEQVETLAVAFIEALYNKRAEEKIEESLKEKEMLLKEIHHRVKNNLAVISSLLSLQSEYIKDKEDLELFRESQTRAKSMALIHERLYQSDDLKRIDFSDYIKTLASDLFRTYAVDPERIKLKMNLETVLIDINSAIPLGLILNELVSNSMKYAFPGEENGQINIKLKSDEDQYLLTVCDDGVGLPEGLDFEKTESLGLQLVNSLTNQIDGIIELDETNGTKFTIKFQESY